MTTNVTIETDDRVADAAHILQHQGEQLVLYRLRCAPTGNGLSHYYMYGDVETEQTAP